MFMRNNLQVVLVRYLNSQSRAYAYLVPPWLEVELHDVVVVEARGNIALAKITSTSPSPHAASYANAYIISKLDLQTHYTKIRKLDEERLDEA